MTIEISEATKADDELVNAFARLIPQLSRSSPPPSREELEATVGRDGTTVFVTRLDGRLVGSLTLVVYRIPTGLRAHIDDVVVDEAASGHRIGEALCRAAIDKAAALGAKNVDLTSRPDREAANHIYEKLGFERRETNVWRYALGT